MKRAKRRHHAQRMKARVLDWEKREADNLDHMFDVDMWRVVRKAENRARCSCWMCGNLRKFFKERTRQEEWDWKKEEW